MICVFSGIICYVFMEKKCVSCLHTLMYLPEALAAVPCDRYTRPHLFYGNFLHKKASAEWIVSVSGNSGIILTTFSC